MSDEAAKRFGVLKEHFLIAQFTILSGLVELETILLTFTEIGMNLALEHPDTAKEMCDWLDEKMNDEEDRERRGKIIELIHTLEVNGKKITFTPPAAKDASN